MKIFVITLYITIVHNYVVQCDCPKDTYGPDNISKFSAYREYDGFWQIAEQ